MSEITLKEYFDTKLEELEKRLDEQRSSDQRALQLQAGEYERRLDILNNEHSRVDKIVEKKVDRSEWDAYHQTALKADYLRRVDFSDYKEQNTRDRSLAMGEAMGSAKAYSLFYSGIALGISLIGIIINVIISFWHH